MRAGDAHVVVLVVPDRDVRGLISTYDSLADEVAGLPKIGPYIARLPMRDSAGIWRLWRVIAAIPDVVSRIT